MLTSNTMNHYEALSINQNNTETIEMTDSFESLKEGLKFLINRYLQHQTPIVASKIVKQLEKILKHHDCSDFPDDRCSFYRLIRHWRAKCI